MRSSKTLLLLCLLVSTVCSHAQTTTKPLFNLGVSTGTSSSLTGLITGADLRLAIPGNKGFSFSWLVSAGYVHMGEKYIVRYISGYSMSNITYTYVNLLAVKAGARFFPARNFYIAADAGIAFPTGS